jgi:hypothetical protein
MKKQKPKQWLYIAGLLCMAVSCKKEDPCGSGACCGGIDQQFSYVKTLENARADIHKSGVFLIEGLINPQRPLEGEWGASLCYQQQINESFKGQLMVTYYGDSKTSLPYKCRVWGTVYNCDDCPTLTEYGKVYYIKLTKIEYQN